MSQLPSVGNSSNPPAGSSNAFNDVNIDHFLKLMITELQNQDPLNPLENDELMAQLGQIRSIAATEQLTETLDSVLLGQNIASATNLIGAEIDAISDDNQRVTGLVDRVSVAKGQPKLHLDLNPRAEATGEAGRVEEGEYEYRVAWEEGDKLLAVDPLAGKTLQVSGDPQTVLISNLPETQATKHVFRREKGETDFHLVGSLTDVKAATFVDNVATEDLAQLVLSPSAQPLDPKRTFTVSLKNVGEIRPPRK